ncbi:hypothetical protein Dimus_020284 [Dionaea muscipula]
MRGFSSHPDLGTFHDKSSSIADLGLIEEMVAVDDGAVAGEVCDGGLGIGVCQAAECLEVVDAEVEAVRWGLIVGRPTTGAVVSPFQLSLLAMGSPSSLIGVVSASGVGEGGSVREEGRAQTVARRH